MLTNLVSKLSSKFIFLILNTYGASSHRYFYFILKHPIYSYIISVSSKIQCKQYSLSNLRKKFYTNTMLNEIKICINLECTQIRQFNASNLVYLTEKSHKSVMLNEIEIYLRIKYTLI